MAKLPNPVNATERYLYDLTEKMELILQVVSDIRDRQDKKDVEMTEDEFYNKLEEAKIQEGIALKEHIYGEEKEGGTTFKEHIDEGNMMDYEDMTKNEIVGVLAKRDVEFNKRDLKDNLIALAKETE